ncbi:leader peptidase (prepilin peptidase)/N-methyltransferase [Jatrophihabitans sp. GAS493]|uniref:prepilin peptidase n=1 Tax=Jatrophihabitans sp. GAS493 TaxID=1907575 RepID=UPI000BC03BB2|nr:A24 family peptidase [Jatrophihabitans sp. GAS493]SOD73668.1 leader peptidase (prepilin peptidase)/N-methyltransferase [Jatrophihabitans sp. GAS493]
MNAPAALIGAVCGAVLSPYLARLSVSAADRSDGRWWRPAPVNAGRVLATTAIAVTLSVLAAAGAGLSAALPALLFLAAVQTPLVVIDYETKRLPDRLVGAAGAGGLLLLGLAAATQRDWSSLLRTLGAGLLVFAIFFAVVMVSPKSFGFGDVKLLGVLAGMLGWFGWLEVYYGVFAGFVLGSIVGVGQLVTRRGTMKSLIPFGPSLIFGAFVVTGLHRLL